MYIKANIEDPSSFSHVINIVGTFIGSLVLVMAVIFACASCRSRKQKKERNRGHSATRNEEVNEYQIPGVNIHHGADGNQANIYANPNEPNIVYTDLDKLALQSGRVRSQPTQPPTQYAIIDEEKLNAARKQRQERHYENVHNQIAREPTIYENAV